MTWPQDQLGCGRRPFDAYSGCHGDTCRGLHSGIVTRMFYVADDRMLLSNSIVRGNDVEATYLPEQNPKSTMKG